MANIGAIRSDLAGGPFDFLKGKEVWTGIGALVGFVGHVQQEGFDDIPDALLTAAIGAASGLAIGYIVELAAKQGHQGQPEPEKTDSETPVRQPQPTLPRSAVSDIFAFRAQEIGI